MVAVLALVALRRIIEPAKDEAVPRVSEEAPVRVREAKVGVEEVAIDCGRERTTVLPAPLSVITTWFAVPVRTRSFVRVAFTESVT